MVDINAARERGIIITNIPAYSTPSVGQMVFAHILNITQQVRHYSEEVSKGNWSKNPDFCFYDTPLIELLGKKIGIVGLGQTGYNTIVSLHCPLNDSTRELINANRLSLMKPTSILINTGRGPLINEQDLANALNTGIIYAAGLDVLSEEPPRADNPLLTARNCFITPHIAWANFEARQRLIHILISNLKAYIDGKPVNVIK